MFVFVIIDFVLAQKLQLLARSGSFCGSKTKYSVIG